MVSHCGLGDENIYCSIQKRADYICFYESNVLSFMLNCIWLFPNIYCVFSLTGLFVFMLFAIQLLYLEQCAVLKAVCK